LPDSAKSELKEQATYISSVVTKGKCRKWSTNGNSSWRKSKIHL
jgi:hypothetical protein